MFSRLTKGLGGGGGDDEDDDKNRKPSGNNDGGGDDDAKKDDKKSKQTAAVAAASPGDEDEDKEDEDEDVESQRQSSSGKGRRSSKRLDATLGRGRSTQPGGNAGGSSQQVLVDIMGSTVGGLGRRVVQGDEEDEESPTEMNEALRRQGAGEVADLATTAGSSIALLNIDLRNEYRKPVVAIAREYRARFHPSDIDGNPLSVWRTPTGRFRLPRRKKRSKALDGTDPHPDLIRFGAGISGYFKWLKLMGVMFVVLLLLQLPVIVFNANAGSYFASAAFAPTATTIGNLYREPQANLSQATVVEVYELRMPPACVDGKCTLDRDAMLFFYGIMDAIVTVVYLGFVCAASFFVRKERRRFGKKVLKVEHWSVQVERVPNDCTPDQLRTHFEQLVRGPVHDVQLVQATGNAISLCVQRGTLLKQLARADATKRYLEKHSATLNKREKAQVTYDALYERIVALDEEAAAKAEEGDALFAFVTFEQQRDRNKCLKLYNTFSCAWHQDEKLQLNGETEIKVSEAPPPSTLLWENNEVSRVSRFARSLSTTLMLCGILAFTVTINYLTEPFKLSKSFADVVVGSGDYTGICEGYFAGVSSFDDALALASDVAQSAAFEVDADTGDSLRDCLCEATLAGVSFPNGTQPDGLYSGDGACAQFLAARTKEVAVQVSVSFATLVLNTVVFLFLTGTARFQRYTSIVEREMTILRRLFLVIYINTGLLVLLVNADLEAIFKFNLTGGGEKLLGNGTFADFTQEWFRVVGAEVMLFGILNVFAPHAYPLLLAVINSLYRELHTPVSQSELNEQFLGPDFVLSYRYAQAMAMIFVVMTYSTGMPILYVCGVVYFPITYWVDKYFFMRVTRTPAEFSGSLARWVNSVLQWAAAVHVLLGMWMLSSPAIFPRSSSDLALGALATLSGVAGKDPGAGSNSTGSLPITGASAFVLDVQTRFFSNQCVPNFLVLLAFLAVKALQNFEVVLELARRTAHKLNELVQYLFQSTVVGDLLAEEFDDERQLTYEQALDSNAIAGIRSYYILANPRYAHAFQQDHGTDSGANENSLLDVLRKRATDGAGLSSAFSTSGWSSSS